METAAERFLRYIRIHTTSDESSGVFPSSSRQLNLADLLVSELCKLNLSAIHVDECGNVIATLPANVRGSAPVLALIAHMDTSPDAPGENVCAKLVCYEGGELKLNDSVSLTEKLCPGIEKYVGEEIIVTDGTTLLGSDDKAGIAEIMTALGKIISADLPHGELRIIFTTDEEIGCGTEGLDVSALGCDYGYTVDGGALGEIEYENFNAAAGRVKINGVGVHPGSAKDVMVNASTAAMYFASLLPADEVPEKTEGYEGFFHLTDMSGEVTSAELRYIIRDHDSEKFAVRKALFEKCGEKVNEKYGEGTCTVTVTDTYRNMKEKILPHMHLIERAEKAFEENGVTPECVPIRGGTDGAVLSWAGLPCPNLSTGGYNFHGVREWIPVKSLEKMSDVLVTLVESFV